MNAICLQKVMKPAKIIEPRWYQERTLDSKARFIAMLGGTGGGKTWWGPIWLAHLIDRHRKEGRSKGARYLVLGRTADMVRDIMVPEIEGHYKGTNLEGVYHKQSRIYELPTGERLYCRSADEPLRIEGHHFMGAWVDEPSQMAALVWVILQARTGYHEAPILFTGYPTGMTWYYYDLYKQWEAGNTDYEMIEFSSIDNPDYPKEEYERAKATLPDWLFAMRYDGKFRKPMGLVYPEFGPDLFVDPFDVPKDWPTFVGLDPGVYFGALFCAWHDGIYYAYAEYFVDYVRPAEEHRGELLDRVKGMLQGWIYDPARITDVVDIGVGPLYKANNAVSAGIVTLTGLIKTERFKVMRGRCPNLVDQMGKYRYPTDATTGMISKETPVKKDDHLPDCARYMVHTIEGAPLEEQAIIVHEDRHEISSY